MTKQMKLSILVTIVILASGGALGLMHQSRLDVLEADHRDIVGKATSLGLGDQLSDLAEDPRNTKRQREEGGGEARAMTAELLAFAREMEAREKQGGKIGDDGNDKAMELMNRLMKLGAPQLKRVIAGLRDDTTVSKDSRANMIGFAIMVLGQDHPAAALALYTESADLLENGIIGQDAVAGSLRLWAKQDPAAALKWVRDNAEAHPDIADEEALQNIIAGAAMTDPVTAFKLMDDMKLDDPSGAINGVVEQARGAEQRTAVLSALRDHLAAYQDESQRDEAMAEALETMGRNLSDESFDSVTGWIKEAGLSEKEATGFAAGLSYFNTGEDSGRWIAWMEKTLPEAAAREGADNLIGQWTQQDYLAAGNWLAGAAEGPAKEAAVATYAETVAEYEPQVAVQWALRLPEGPERQETLERIYQDWPARDAAAAEAFAKQYGIAPKKD